MPLSVETAVVTKKGPGLGFNTDAVNAVGKVWAQEVIHGEKGVRAVGACSENPYYVLASSKIKGTSASAVDLFKNCVEQFNEDGSNASMMIADYLRAFARVLDESGLDSSVCSFAILAGFDDTVYAAKSGDCMVYTYYDGTFTEIDPQATPYTDQKSSFGVAQCNHVSEGDVFLLLSGGVARALPDGLLEAICSKADGDIKKIAAMITAQAEKHGCEEAVSSVIMKITAASPAAAVAAAPEKPAAEEADAAGIAAALAAAAEEHETAAPPAPVQEAPVREQAPMNTKQSAKKGKRAGVLFFSCILALGLLAGMFFVVRGLANGTIKNPFAKKETTTQAVPETQPSESATEPTDDTEPSSTADVPSEEPSASEPESEPASEPESNKEENTTKGGTSRRNNEGTNPANP